MLVSAFDTFVRGSDQSIGKPEDVRRAIAIYGLSAEVGSVISAIKKRLLAEGGDEQWDVANDEIIEELGDVVWYCFSLADIANPDKPVNIFCHDIANLKREISAGDDRADRIRRVLHPDKRAEFLLAAEKFPKRTKVMEFEDYQTVAILTARTEPRTLVEVCLAVLLQLSAELLRKMLPAIELELNKFLADRPINDILGEIAWHLSALASIYSVRLSDIAQKNMDKVSFRLDRKHPTPLHDSSCSSSQQFPRQFEVAFVTISKGRSRMYLDGRRLGDDLTDNAYNDDGYRFHDVMHLANVAKLGWSPVLRDLMKRKRKVDPTIDEVEDGARARIVEEAIIKAIHSEGERVAKQRIAPQSPMPTPLFVSSSEITFRFLKFIRSFVEGLEVEINRYWEWEDAILEGHKIFHCLRCEGQGTVIVDLDARTVYFKREVCIELTGKVAGFGSARLLAGALDREVSGLRTDGEGKFIEEKEATHLVVQKLAILDALGISRPTELDLNALEVKELEGRDISVKATGAVQHAMWAREVVSFRTTKSYGGPGEIYCNVIALADN